MVSETPVNDKPPKVWILAGEASGDAYGAALARAIHERQPETTIQGMGASQMQEAGVDILVDSTDLGIVGFVEVIKHLPMFLRLFKGLVRQAEAARPDVVVLIDYPGFNLRFAKKMHQRGIKVVYFVSPQVWAWGKGRVKEMARIIQHMIVIFPFEEPFYRESGLPATFVGHPMVHMMREASSDPVERDDALIALMPGSRMSEVSRLIRPMLETARKLHQEHPQYRFVIPVPNQRLENYIQNEIKAVWPAAQALIRIAPKQANLVMQQATAGLAASGTVTVQCAIMGLPLVVMYKVNAMTYAIGKRLINVKYITMVNIVADDLVFEEFIQDDAEPEKVLPALESILPGGSRRQDVLTGMDRSVNALQSDGKPTDLAADIILKEASAS